MNKKIPKIQTIQQFVAFKKKQLEYKRIPWLREVLKQDIEILEHLDETYKQLHSIHEQELQEEKARTIEWIDKYVKLHI